MVETFIADTMSPRSFRANRSHDILATAYLKGIIGKLNRATPSDSPARRTIDQTLVPMLAQLATSNLCWQPEVGAVMQRMREGNLQGAAVQALLVLHSLGLSGSWELLLSQSTDFSFAGNFFSCRGAITVSASDSELQVGGAEGQFLHLVRQGTRWVIAGGGAHTMSYRQPGYCRHARFEGVYVHDWMEPEVIGEDVVVEWPITVNCGARQSLVSAALDTIDAGLAVLAQADESYLRWVEKLFRGVAATAYRHDDMRQSGSYLDHPGVFNCGFPGHAAASTAEVIVHEMSHQNFLLLNSVFPLCVDHADDQIYSALKGRKRPLSRVLFAYHAAANMALFWDDLAAKGPLNPYYETERQTIYRHALSLTEGLSQARGLTEAGAYYFKLHNALLGERGIVGHAA